MITRGCSVAPCTYPILLLVSSFPSYPHPFGPYPAPPLRHRVAGAAGPSAAASGKGLEVDIIAVLEHWVDGVDACSRCCQDLAGRLGAVTPLAASADARSHASHLRSLLSAHAANTQQLHALQTSLATDVVGAGEGRRSWGQS